MGEHAALRRNLQPRDNAVQQPQQFADHGRIVAGRIDPDARIARSQQQAVEDRGGNAPRVVEGMVGLQPHAHPARQADSVAKRRCHRALLGDHDQVLVAHQLGNTGGHFRCDPGREFRQRLPGRGVRQQPVAEAADGQRRNSCKAWRIVAVEDQACDLVVLVRDNGFIEKLLEREVGERHARRDHLLGAVGRNAGETVARARRGRFGEQVAQIIEHVGGGIDNLAIDHDRSCRVPVSMAWRY